MNSSTTSGRHLSNFEKKQRKMPPPTAFDGISVVRRFAWPIQLLLLHVIVSEDQKGLFSPKTTKKLKKSKRSTATTELIQDTVPSSTGKHSTISFGSIPSTLVVGIFRTSVGPVFCFASVCLSVGHGVYCGQMVQDRPLVCIEVE